ncbi:MAG: hypothetical protein V7K40_17920 [Nostoc sp.]
MTLLTSLTSVAHGQPLRSSPIRERLAPSLPWATPTQASRREGVTSSVHVASNRRSKWRRNPYSPSLTGRLAANGHPTAGVSLSL